MYFTIQTIDGQVRHDFTFTLLASIEYQNWYRQTDEFQYSLTDAGTVPYRESSVPVGSVEFVSNYLATHYNRAPAPRNIPDPLIPFAGRKVVNGTHETSLATECFAKSRTKIKGFADFVAPGGQLDPGEYQFSEKIEIDSEYRCFF